MQVLPVHQQDIYWYPLKYHKEQSRGWLSKARFRLSPAGRRSGKTEIFGKRSLILKALKGGKWPNWKGFAAAPTRDQAKRIYWSDLKKMVTSRLMRKKPSESRLIIYLVNGSEIHVLGMDKPERAEGTPWDHGVLDEYGNMKKETWTEHIRPALSDRQGTCDFIGVPEGRNHFYDLWKKALADTSGVWDGFHWLSSDILDKEEIKQAKKDLDQLVFNQEYCGSFLEFSGRCYHNFKEDVNVGKIMNQYNQHSTINICLDFNIAPGTATIIQEYHQYPKEFKRYQKLLKPSETYSGIIGEVHIPRDSNTIKVCNKIIEDWGMHKGTVILYGDATGGAKGTAKVKGSDWDLIEQKLRPVYGHKLRFDVPPGNPRERSRVNAVNCRISNTFGQPRLIVDGKNAPYTIKDFEGVRLLEGSAGEIDKKRDPELTHLSDGVGYYIYKRFPVKQYKKQTRKYWN